MEIVSKFLTQQLVKNRMIESESAEIYEYGFKLILSSLFIIICIGLMGIIGGCIISAVVYICAFMHIRHYSGGYHANTYKKCFILSNSLFLVTLVIIVIQARYQLKYSLIIFSWLSTIYLWIAGGDATKRNPKTAEELAYRKRKVRRISFGYSLVSTFLFLGLHQYLDIGTILICTQIYTVFTVWINKREKGELE
ncbi:MAG: hypothetical protein E7231_00080 [Cellulosilyticum sp.]|nr:hypothetical protein [Cellulosilyticum sp.]